MSTRRPASPRNTASLSTVHRMGKLSRWGNSLGLRIPQEAVAQLKLKEGESVELAVTPDSITIRRQRPRKKWSEGELLKGATPTVVGGEIDWGKPVGKEAL